MTGLNKNRTPESGIHNTDLLLDLQNFPLELALDSLQSLDSSLDGGSQRLDVSGRLADQRSETVLHHAEESRVLRTVPTGRY